MEWEAIAAALGAELGALPVAALLAAREQWASVAPRLLAHMADWCNGTDRSPETANILFFLLHLAAEQQDQRVFAPLCALARDEAAANTMLEGAVEETLGCMLVRTYDGDPAPLHALIEDAAADEFVRWVAFGALAWLTAAGRIPRPDTTAWLRGLFATLEPQGESFVWDGWQAAVAGLGLSELRDLVVEQFRREFVPPEICDLADFETTLHRAMQASDPMAVLRDEGPRMFDDAIVELAGWAALNPNAAASPQARDAEVADTVWPADQVFQVPWVNPYRHVGRNDPCPCGSGRKFKKCCLGTLAA